jgi:hypothetical protein
MNIQTNFGSLVQQQRDLVKLEQEKLDKLISQCRHEELIDKEQYHHGTESDSPCTVYWKQCSVCGAHFEKTFVQHGQYW